MNLIDQVTRLKALETKATIVPWETEESDEGHEIRMGEAIESRGQYQTHHVIEYNHGCELLDDPGEAEEEQYSEAEANAYLISDLRNAAPAMLEVLGGFQPGDADLLDRVPCFRTDGDCDKCSPTMKAACGAVARMQAMAAKMEATE